MKCNVSLLKRHDSAFLPILQTEGIRGVESYKATNFPTQLGLGHTWNRQLIHQVGLITGREARMLGYTNVYAPDTRRRT